MYEDEDEDDGAHEYDDYDQDMTQASKAGTPGFRGFTSINPGKSYHGGASVNRKSTRSNPSNSRFGVSARKSQRIQTATALPGTGKASVVPGIAKDLIARTKDASLTESDDLILATEDIISRATEAVEERGLLPEVTADILSQASSEYLKLWPKHAESYRKNGMHGGLGPGESASPISKATFVSSLLLSLHHSPLQQSRQPSWNPNSRGSLAVVPIPAPKATPVPQLLLDWLDRYHISMASLIRAIGAAEPNCTSHALFWESLSGMLVRGKFKEIIQLLNQADFRHAATALDDGETRRGYHGAQLQTVQSVVGRARQLLEASPAVKYGDWQINNSEWSMYRKRVEAEVEYLADTAEGNNLDDEDDTNTFQAEHFGIRSTTRSLTQSTRRAQSNVPWTIYQNLKIFYNILLGSTTEIIAQSQDWLEASIALTVWWDGTQDDSVASWSLNVSRQVSTAPVSEDPYLSRLSACFLAVTDPEVQESFQINTLSMLEVGLASVLQGNVDGALGALRSWSLVIASAVAEIGSLGGWVRPAVAPKPAGLNEEDLMVLSYGQEQKPISKDDILHKYAEELFEKDEIQSGDATKEGWELAILVASRIDDQKLAKDTISKLLDNLHLTSQDRMDKLVMLCTGLGLEDQARNVSERFADHLMATTTMYGPALICFARAHATNKLKTLVSLLVSYSLVSSVAYPLEDELDPSLSALLHNPKATLSNIADFDSEAASLLQFHLAGYASLRKYYTLRDAHHLPKTERSSYLRPLARTRLAAKYLIAVIKSASDSIYGGLYDATRENAIQVDGLLTLLGEATALLTTSQPSKKRILARQQIYDLLQAIEDLETVSDVVRSACQECFNATIQHFSNTSNGGGGERLAPPSPRSMLKKSVSSGSGSNFSFSMMGSEMLVNSGVSGGKSVGGSGVLIPSANDEQVKRGWDWRKNFQGGEVKGEDVLKVLRKGLASELAVAMLRADDD